MKRLVWGIILVVIGIVGQLSPGNRSKPAAETWPIAMVIVGTGAALIYFGGRYLSRRKDVANVAFQQLREKQEINAGEMSSRFGMAEYSIRELIADAQKRGILPFNAKIV